MAIKGAQGSVTIIDRATAPLRKIAESFMKLATASTDANSDMLKIQNSINGIAKAQSRLGRMGAYYEKQTKDIGNQAVGVLALGYSFKRILDPAIKFESAMTGIDKVLDVSPAQLKQMGKELKNMSKEIPVSAEGLANIAAAMGGIGLIPEQVIPATRAVAIMSTAFEMSAEDAGDSMGKLMNVYGLTVDQVTAVGDTINAIDAATAAKARKTVDVLGRIGGSAKIFGLTASQAAGLAGAFLDLGVAQEVAGTGINALLNKLGTADKQGEKFQKALQGMGMSAKGLKSAIAKDATGALNGFIHSLAKVKQSERMGVLTDLFGAEYADDIALVVGGIDRYDKATKVAANTTANAGSMQKEFQKQSETTANKMQILQGKVESVAISVGTILLPAISTLATILGNVAAPMEKLINDFPVLTKIVGVIAGVIITAKVATLAYTSIMWLAVPAINAMSASLAIAKYAMIGLNLAMSLSPINRFLILLTALMGAGILLAESWEPVKAFWIDLWNYLEKVITSFGKISGFTAGWDRTMSAIGLGDNTVNMAPATATTAIRNNTVQNTPVAVHVNVADGRVKSVETSGGTKANVFLNNGKQN